MKRRMIINCMIVSLVVGLLYNFVMPYQVLANQRTTMKPVTVKVLKYENKCHTGKLSGRFYYELPQLKGESDAVSKINKILEKDYKQRLKEKRSVWKWVKDEGKSVTYKDTYYSLTRCKVEYNEHGYVSFSFASNWYAGAVGNEWTYGLTFDIKTGRKLKLSEVIKGSATKFRSKIIEKYEEKVRQLDDFGKEQIENTKINDFKFYLKKGKVVICFGPYQPGGGNGQSKITLNGNYE